MKERKELVNHILEQETKDRPLLLFNKHLRSTDQATDEISTPFYLFATQKPGCFY